MTKDERRIKLISKAVDGVPPNVSIPRLITLLLSWGELLDEKTDVDVDEMLRSMKFEEVTTTHAPKAN